MPKFTAHVRRKYVEVRAFGTKFVYTKDEFANVFGDVPIDDAHARELIADYCGESKGSPYRRNHRLMTAV